MSGRARSYTPSASAGSIVLRMPSRSSARGFPRISRALTGGRAPREQLAHLVVRGLGEVLVPAPDGLERLRRDRADDVVDLRAQRLAGLGRRHGDGDDDAGRLLLAQRPDGGLHGGSGGQTVVDEDHGALAHLLSRTVASV